jgi:hypothetical protein
MNTDKKRRREVSNDDLPANNDEGVAPTEPRPTRFRFKSKHSESRHHSSRDDEDREYRSRRHRHKRRRSATPPNPYERPALDEETAFRESLFDAMADDEGAAYWESVYGQPLSGYSNERIGPTGELEQMTDEEYAAYVRQKMWEKTHQGMLEERARRAEDKKRRIEEQKEWEKEERKKKKLREEMEKTLQRGEERRRQKLSAQRWQDYVQAWKSWDTSVERIPWPTQSGQRKDIGEYAIRDFLVQSLSPDDESGNNSFTARLKEERVRWHPDKMQQKLGGQVDDTVMRDITAIFQVIDKLWADTRSKA